MRIPEPAAWAHRLWSRRAALRASGRFAGHVWRRLLADDVLGVAASLSFTSLLALVPLLTIALSVLAAFPVFDRVRTQLQTFLFDTFLPAVGMAVEDQLAAFIAAADRLTALGVVGLAVTAVLLMVTVEGAFNRIFRVVRGRRILMRVVIYWTILTLGPLLIGASFAIASALAEVALGTRASDLWTRLSLVVPFVLTLAAFSLLYLVLPNRRVRLRDALAGAAVAALLFAALRFGFVLYIANVKTYQTLYGAVAAIPIFLIWMFLSWTVVLAGAVVTAALPEWRLRRGVLGGTERQARLILALDLLAVLAASGPRGLTRSGMLKVTAAPEEALLTVVERLRQAAFLARTTEGRWVLVRPLGEATLHDLVEALDLELPELPPRSLERQWHEVLSDALARAHAQEAEVLRIPLARLLDHAPPSDTE